MLFEQNTREILKDPVLEAEMKLNRKTVLNFKEDVIGVLPNAPNAPNHTIQDFKYGAFGIAKEKDICGWDKFTNNRDYSFPILKGIDPFTKWNFSYDKSNPQMSKGIEAKDEVERLNQFETKGGQLKDYVVPEAKNHTDVKSFGDVGHKIVIKERAEEMMMDHADDANFANYRKQAQRRARARNVNFTASNLQPASDAGSSVSSLSSRSNPTTISSSSSSSSSGSSGGESGNDLFERSIGTVGTNTLSSSSSTGTSSVASSGHSVQPFNADSLSPIYGSNSSSSTKGIRIFPALNASDHSVHPPSTESETSAPKRSAFKRMKEASVDANYEPSSSSTSTLSTKSTRAKQLMKKAKLLEKQKKEHKPNNVYAFDPSTGKPMKHLGLMPRAEARAVEHTLSLQYKSPTNSKGESAESKVEVESLVDSKKEASVAASLKSINRPTRISKINLEATRNGQQKATYEYANDLIKQLNGEKIRNIKQIGVKIGEQLYKYYGITPNASLNTKRQIIGYLETLAKPPAGASASAPKAVEKAPTKTK